MGKSDVPYVKHSEKTQKEASVPPLPKTPDLHPERPPPNVPIPGEPSGGGEAGAFVCKICCKSFNSKDELRVHVKMDHKSPKK